MKKITDVLKSFFALFKKPSQEPTIPEDSIVIKKKDYDLLEETNSNLVEQISELKANLKNLENDKKLLAEKISILETGPDLNGKFVLEQKTLSMPRNFIDRVMINGDGKSLYNRVELLCYDKTDRLHAITWSGVYDISINNKVYSFGQHKKAQQYINDCIANKKIETIVITFVNRA